MPRPRNDGMDPRVLKALAHPLRVDLLSALNLKVASPKMLAEELGEPLPNVSYHVRVLLDAGCIELVRTEPRRGALEHFYRAQMRPLFRLDEWTKLPPFTRRTLSSAILRQIWSDTAEATLDGSFDAREERHLSRSKLLLDEQGWQEVTQLLGETMDRAHEIHAESVGRAQKSGEETLYTDLVMMHYTGKPDPKDDRQPVPERARTRKNDPAEP